MSQDPKTAHPTPPQPGQGQSPPGVTKEMTPRPDHGEHSYRGCGKLAGKAAIVTGADSGIGRAVAIAFAREGADVLISYLDEHEDAKETARWVEEAGHRAVTVPGDVADEAYCRTLVDRAEREFGKLDILVNNAAMQRTHKSIEEISSDEWDRTFRTNIYSMFYLCKAAVARMQPGSAIVNTSSINATDPNPSLLAYATTKGAIANFTAGLAQLVAKQGIRVNAVAPRADLDSVDPLDDGGGGGEELRQKHAARPRRPACRARARLCAAGFRRGELHHRRACSGHRRKADALRARRGRHIPCDRDRDRMIGGCALANL